MSMLKICGQELELDLFDADTMEVYEKSMDEVVKRAEESKKHTELSNAGWHPGDVRNREKFLR